MHMFESHGHAMSHGRITTFLVKNALLSPVTPNDPRLTFDPLT